MTGYMITDKKDRTKSLQWGPGIMHQALRGHDPLLIGGTGGWILVFPHPLLAVFLNPLCENYDLKTAHLWKVDAEGPIRTARPRFGRLVLCARRVTAIERVELPQVSREQRVKFAILCALKVYPAPGFVEWAERWLKGTDRSDESAKDVFDTVSWVQREAGYKAGYVMYIAGSAAREAAEAAWWFAGGLSAECIAAFAVSEAIQALETAKRSTADGVPEWADNSSFELDFVSLACQAVEG